MRRVTPYVAICVILITVFYTFKPNNQKREWVDYIQNHPYSQKADLGKIEGLPKQDRPDLASQQNFLMTVDPELQYVPTERLLSAFQTQKKLQSRMSADAIAGVTWEERGPNNIGGRTRALMWDPNDANNEKLWAAGVAGGIWFNNNITDAQSSWQNVDDFMANLAVTTLAYDPTNTQVFYAGTGEGYFNGGSVRGAGIFKSTDGGANWSQVSSTATSTFNFVQRVVVTSSGTILASTRDDGVQRSIDGGTSWTTVLNASSTGASTSRGNDLEIAANGDVYASLGIFSNGSIHRSIDDGATWTAITPSGGSPERIELAVAPSASSSTATTVIYAVASFDVNIDWFKKSVDGGDTWSDITIPKYRSQSCSESSDDFTRGQAWYDLALAVNPTDADVVLAGGINVSKSADGGTTMAEVSYWTGGCDDYVHADIHNIVFRPGNSNEAVIGSDGGVSYSADVGSSSDPSFDDRNKDYNVTQFYAVAAQNTAEVDYFIAGAQDNGTQQFTDANGLATVSINGGDGAFCFIDQDDNNFQISSYVYNVYDRHDATGGFTGSLVNNQNKGRFINPADYDNSSDILYSAGDSDELMRISGITTTPNSQEALAVALDGGQVSTIRADAYADNRVFVGTGSGNIYRIDNADATPSVNNITSNITTNGYISSIDIGASDDEIIVTYSNYGVISVWYTEDGGTSWVDKDNDASLPDMPVRWALFNPNNSQEVLLATELGVWSTSDITAANPGWQQSSDNLANVRCDMLQYRSSDNLVVVATHGRGVFTSNTFDGLAAPTDFNVTQDADFITLSWSDNSADEDNYIVERSIGDETSYSVIATLNPDTETYADATPETNELVYYKVYGTSVLEGDSRVLEAEVLSLPAAPTFGATTDATTAEFTINWTVDDGASIFFLDVSESDDFSDFLPGYESRLVSGLSSTISNRPSGTYYFRVAASNTSGLSDFSAVGTIILDPLSITENEIIGYPNPSTGHFTIRGLDSKVEFELIDMLGQKVDFKVVNKEGGFEFDISSLMNGSYLLRISHEFDVITKTIVKK
ncbi:T9SS type A sorting domain-containing protein [Ekhidna sp.]|uniref:T9SS type A sorting domain-containing protein n=1 Tax=Ekhidna sp. TaxID=2608089 RepID=UPI003298715B